jgi:mono/diheme cytochrome c family protein
MTPSPRSLATAALTAAGAFVAFAGSVLVAGCARAEEPMLVESGRASYEKHCAACHGLKARGNGILKPVLRVAPADLTRIAQRRGGVFPDAEIARYIDGRADVAAHGSREMPVWGRVFAVPVADGSTGEEVVRGQLWILVEYLRSIQVGPAAPAPEEASPETETEPE